jgi:competence protein ComEA
MTRDDRSTLATTGSTPDDPAATAPAAPVPTGERPAAPDGLTALRAALDQPVDWSDRAWAWLSARRREVPVSWLVAAGVALVVLLVGGLAWVGWSRAVGGAPSGGAAPASSGSSESGRSGRTAGVGATRTGGDASSDPSSSAGSGGSPGRGGAVVVEVAGAVAHPGVYHLGADDRVADLIARAGGLAPDADADRVNQAAALVDGTMIYVPRQGQTDVPAPVGGASGGDPSSGGDAGSATPAVVDLNTATAAQLDSLPGVGPATAAAILAYRRQHGPFAQVDDLADVAGIGPAKLAQIRPHVRV